MGREMQKNNDGLRSLMSAIKKAKPLSFASETKNVNETPKRRDGLVKNSVFSPSRSRRNALYYRLSFANFPRIRFYGRFLKKDPRKASFTT